MTTKTGESTTGTTTEGGMIILTTTVSAVVWFQVILWVWAKLAEEGWWGSPTHGARVAAAVLALVMTWVIWGRVAYWLSMPNVNSESTS